MGHHFGSGSNPAQTRVGYKEIRKHALHDHNPDALIGLKLPAEFVEFLRQNFIKQVYRRVIDADKCDSRIKPEPETFVIRIWQGSGSIPFSQSFCTGLVKTPIPSISTSKMSPACMYTGGLRAAPTPPGVPVMITSPRSRLIATLMVAISTGTLKMSRSV